MRLAAPGDAMLYAAASDMASTFEQMSLTAPTWGPGNGLPSTLATWQPPEYNPADQPDRYQPPSSLTSFYVPPKKSHPGRWIAFVLVLAVAGGGVGYKLMKDRQEIHTTLPAGSGVAAGDPTVPPDGPGTVYTSRAGHFAYRTFDATHVQGGSDSGSEIGIKYTSYTVIDRSVRGVILGGETPRPLTTDEARAFLRAGTADSNGADGSDTITEVKLTSASFRGRPALHGSYVDDGVKLYILAVMYGDERFYLLVANSEAALSSLQKSFVALP